MSETSRIANKYDLIKVLGEGGFGKVYLAKHTDLDVYYAIKLIRMEKTSEENFLARFKREAQILTRLLHKNSIPLRDFGKTEDGYFYMAMDYCPGKSLRDIINTYGYIPASKFLDFVIQILDVLDEAHKLGIIHRDLKPENIMIQQEPDGRETVKVLDFGIAKLARNLDESGLNAVTLTKNDAIIGSPMYMSPEQATGETLDGRSDIYSLGMVMYNMATGKVPFETQTDMHTLMMQMQSYPETFSEIRPDLEIPKTIEQIVFKCIQKDKTKRFTSAKQLAEICKKIKDSGVPSTPFAPGALTQMAQSILPGSVPLNKAGGKSSVTTSLTKTSMEPALSPTGTHKESTITGAKINKSNPLGTGKRSAISHRTMNASSPLQPSGKNKGVVIGIIAAGVIMMALSFFLLMGGDKTEEHYKNFVSKAREYLEKNSYEKAEDYVNKALKLKRNEGEAKDLLQEIHKAQYNALISQAKKDLQQGDSSKALRSLEEAKNLQDSDEVQKILRECKNYIRADALLAEAKQHIDREQYGEAERKIQQVLEIRSTEEVQKLLLRVQGLSFYEEALRLENQNNLSASLALLKKAKEKISDSKVELAISRVQAKMASSTSTNNPKNTSNNNPNTNPSSNGRFPFLSSLEWENLKKESSDGKMFRGGLELQGAYPSSGKKPKGKLKWKVHGGQVYCEPVVMDGVIYISAVQGRCLQALDAKTGKSIWKTPTAGGAFSTPAISGNMIFTADSRGIIYGIQRSDGKVKWKFPLPKIRYRDGEHEQSIHSSPVVVQEKVLFATPTSILALHKESGDLLWEVKAEGSIRSISPAVDRGLVYVVMISSGGGVLWILDLKGNTFGYVYMKDPQFQTLPQMSWWYSSPVVRNGTVYVSNFWGMVYAIDMNQKRMKWQTRKYSTENNFKNIKTGFWIGTPAVADNKVFIGGTDGFVYALDEETGVEIWKSNIKKRIFSSPSVADGVVYVGSRDGNVYALDQKTGKELWKIHIGSWVEGGAAVVDGIVYVGHMGSEFFAIE